MCTVDFNELGLDLTWHTKRAGTCGTAAGVGLRHGKNSTLPWRRTKSRITYYINMSSISIERPRSSSRGGRSSNSSSSYRCLWWCPIYRGWLSCLIRRSLIPYTPTEDLLDEPSVILSVLRVQNYILWSKSFGLTKGKRGLTSTRRHTFRTYVAMSSIH